MDEKRDSAPYTDIYTHFIDMIELLPAHRQHLKVKRGFTDETIDRCHFRSTGPHLEPALLAVRDKFDLQRTKEAGLVDDFGPAKKLLKENILIPYFNPTGQVTYIRPHKDALHGLRMPVYCPGSLQSFTILTESEFKATACWQWGFSGVGIAGVSACAGKNYSLLTDILKANAVTSVCIVFDNEVKDNPKLPLYKPQFWDRFDTQLYSYLMAVKLAEDGYDTSIGVLPTAWMQNGKIDLDGALAQGKSRQDMAIKVLRERYKPTDYLKTLPRDAAGLIQRRLLRSQTRTGINEFASRYWIQKEKKDGTIVNQPITNFTFSIENNIIDFKKICVREVNLVNNVGDTINRAVFRGEDMNHPVNFKKRCFQLGDYQFTGSAKDLEQLIAYETAREIGKRVYQPDHVGFIKDAGLYLFANGGIDLTGNRLECDSEGVVWRGLAGHQAIQFHQGDSEGSGDIPVLAKRDMDPGELIDLIEQNYSGNMAIRLACAWLIASFFSHRLSQIFGRVFPLLFVTGQTQTGKTTLCEWLSAMAGLSTRGYSFSVGTEVGLERGSFYYSSLPFWLDEYRNSYDNTQKRKESFFRSAYDRQMGLKGVRNEFGVRGGAIRAGILVSGQDTPGDLALQQRFITIRLKRQRSGENYNQLQALMPGMSGILPRIVASFYRNNGEIIEAAKKMRGHLFAQGVDDRTSVTYAIVMGPYDQIVRQDHKEFFDFIVDHARTSFEEKEKERPTLLFLLGLQELKDKIYNTCVRAVSGCLAIYFQGAYGAYQTMMRQRGQEVSWKKNTILDEFQDTDYFVQRERSVRMAGQNVKCLMLDPTKDELVMDIYDAAKEEE